MSTKRRVVSALVAVVALDVWAVASCTHRARSTPPKDALAIGDVPGAVPVIPSTTRSSQSNPRPVGGNTIAPIPAPGEDSAATAQRKLMNVPKFGDYVFVTKLPEAVDRVKPEYPAALRGSGVDGTVMVQALVLADGTVADTRVIKSIPPLDEAAVSCVRKWRFKPALNQDVPTAVWVGVPIRFDAEPH
jgi:TonB family protein